MRLHLLAFLSIPLLSLASNEQQIPMHNEIKTDEPPLKHTLADLLTVESSSSIFYSYARELELSAIFSDTRVKSTVFVPTNKAVMALARKPHQGPKPIDDGIVITEEDFDNMSKENVEHWVSAHIVPESPISLDTQEHPTMLSTKSITFTPISKGDSNGAEWSRVTLENGVRIIGMKEGLNGVLYLIDGTVSYD